jgi:quinol monooxygenase YgiN
MQSHSAIGTVLSAGLVGQTGPIIHIAKAKCNVMETRENQMPYVLVTHKVEDFDRWKDIFDEVAPMREEAGEKSATVYRDVSDPNTVTALFEWDTLENAHEYTGSDRLKAAMRTAGVISAPQIAFLDGI